MKSLENVIDAILAHLRSWPAFYADPGRTPSGEPTIPPVSGAAAPVSPAPPVRGRYRVEPTRWGVGESRPAPTSSRRSDGGTRRSPVAARRRRSSLPGAHLLPAPRGLLTCSPEASRPSR